MKEKNHGEFIRNFAAVQPFLYRYICSLLPNFSDADDILQEVAVISWDKYDSFDQSKSTFQAWILALPEIRFFIQKEDFYERKTSWQKPLKKKLKQNIHKLP